MKMLVTGAAGFIGSHVTKRLLNENHEVVGIDNLNDYYDVTLKKARLGLVDTFSKFTFHKMDLVDKKAIANLFKDEKFDAVIHLAAQAGVRYSIENPFSYVDSNLTGMMTILEGCRNNNIEHLVFASSSSVYGLNKKIPYSVKDRVDNPVSLYAATKRSGELMSYSYSHLYNLKITALRFFTVYGPYGRPDMSPFIFTKNIIEDKPIKLFNNGNHKRDFTYIDDIVSGVLLALNHVPKSNYLMESKEASSVPFKILNIGNNKPINLLEYVCIIEEVLGKEAIKVLEPMQLGDVENTWADIDEMINVGYRPSIDLKLGMKKFIDWFIDFYDIKKY
jgi:UDP-glucuronate 4-epimerase